MMHIYSSQRHRGPQGVLGLIHGHNTRQTEPGASPTLNAAFVSKHRETWRSGLFIAGRCRAMSLMNVSRYARSRRYLSIPRASNDGNHVAMPYSSDPISDMDGRKIFILEDMTIEQLHDFHMRLCENDVEYHDLKSMCKLNGLGGKDMKYNLRAKLIRKVREMLGKPVWDRRSYGRRVKLPSAMTDVDLAKFYKQREVVMPDDKEDAIGLAFAMLVVDGAISQDVVPTTSAYDKLNTKRLIQICQKRNLPTKGNKAELLARLVDYDAQREKKALADKAADAARRELEQATIDVPPRPPNRAMAADLREAQNTMASVSDMDLPYLRAALLARNLPIYGTSEVLIERLTNVLRKDVIEAHAGLGRMIKYAEAAVSKLNDDEVYEALAARGLASFSVGEDSSSRLANTLVEEWIHDSMMPSTVDWGSDEDQEHRVSDLDDGEPLDDVNNHVDPTIHVTLLCDGLTQAEKERSLRAAREILPSLQSDQIWGTLMPYTSSVLQDRFDEVFNASPDCSEPPTETVDIMYLTPSVNGVVATLSAPIPPLGSVFRVCATPSDCEDASSVIASGISQDIVLKGLRPGTAYEFTATIVNKVGEGPRSEPYHAATLLRQGVSVSVVYPVVTEDGGRAFTELSWEELYGWDAGALDSLLPQNGKRIIMTEDSLKNNDSIILPMGHTPSSFKGMDAVSALSVFHPDYEQTGFSRHAMLDKVASIGFKSLPLLTLNKLTESSSNERLRTWVEENRIDPIVGRFKMKLSDNEGPMFSIVCRGLEVANEVIESIKNDTQNLSCVTLEVESLLKDAVSIEVNVIGTEKGPVALVPTEIDYFDINDFIEISDIEVTRLTYQNGGYDIDMLERIVKLKREDVLIPASYDSQDKDLSQSRNIRHLTPPTSISVDLMNHLRLSAVKVFKEMGLRDYARISFIVSPEIDVKETEQDTLALVAFDAGAKKIWESDNNYCSIKVESFASLLEKEAVDTEERKAFEASLISQHSEKTSSIVSDIPSTRYGEIFGIPIDDRTRLDIQEGQSPVIVDAIPTAPPPGIFEGLNDASALEISNIHVFNESDEAKMLYITNIDVIPDLDSKVGTLAQQLVASGLSLNWLPKQLISLAASRQGQPSLIDSSVSIEEIKDGDEDWVGVNEIDIGQEPEEVTMDEIATAIQHWESGSDQPDVSLDADQDERDITYDEIINLEEIEVALEQSVATLNESDDLQSSIDEENSTDVSKVLAQQFPGLHPCRQRVWILCGGEGYQRDESLKAAAAAMKALQGAPDLLMETFMLDPPNAGHANDTRLKSLVSLREDLLKSGASDAFLFSEIPYLHPAQIKAPPTSPPQDLHRRGVWRLSGSNIVRETVEDMRNSIDRITKAHKLTVVSRSPGDDLHRIDQIVDATQSSLKEADASFDVIRAPWGGSLEINGSGIVPRYLSLHDWTVAASEKCAVVLMFLPGHPSAYGPIQELMDEVGVPYTGPSKIAADLCHERPELLRSLTDAVNYDGSIISAPPAHSISALELRATCQSEDSANEFFSRLFGTWENKMMTIRPSIDCGVGVLRMKSGLDLMTYNRAVHTWAESISAGECDGTTEDVQMPLPPPTQFVIEPFLEAKPIKLACKSEDHGHEVIKDPVYGDLVWDSSDNWLEVHGSLLGGSGTMRCLGLSTKIARSNKDGSITSLFEVTPPPSSILSEETSGDTMLRLQLVCDRLGLSGAAQITLLVNAVTGEIVINEVNAHPDLSPNGLLMRHSALVSPPMSHVDVLRELLKEAMSRGEQNADGDAAESTAMYPVDEFSASMGGILDAPDAPNPTQNYFGDPYLKVEDGYQYGFEGVIDFGEEESDDDDFDSEEGSSSDEY